MSTLRKQTIVSTVFMMLGFLFGAINIYFYTKTGVFTKAQFGLTKIFFDFLQLAIALSSLGFLAVLYKFYPYFSDNLPKQKNELLTLTFIVSLFGFLLFCIAGYFIKPIFIKQYLQRSPLIIEYYPYLFLFAFGGVLFTVLEYYSWVKHKSIVANFLKETALRFISFILIMLFLSRLINFNRFILGFSLQFVLLFCILFAYYKSKDDIHFSFSISRVSKKFWKKMLSMQILIYGGTVIIAFTGVIDSFVIAKLLGISIVGDFTIAQYASTFVNVPQKAILGGSIGILTKAWKDKNIGEISRIYSRSCINLSLMALFIFGHIWLNVSPAIDSFNIDASYKAALSTMFFICVARTIDASTGLNGIIIGTSTFWKFDFISGMILLAIRLPTTWFLIVKYGLLGSSIADVISITIFNFIRFEYLRRKYNMQPFNYKNMLAIVLAVLSYFIAFYSCKNIEGIAGMIVRASLFSVVFIVGIFALNLTPDAMQLWNKWVRKIDN
jgi:O-antigen/teichoic acid export membrane protein